MRESNEFSLDFCRIIKVRHCASQFKQLRLDQEAIPESLQKMINQTFSSIEKSKLCDIAPQKIENRPRSERQTVVESLFHQTFRSSLRAAGSRKNRLVAREQPPFVA